MIFIKAERGRRRGDCRGRGHVGSCGHGLGEDSGRLRGRCRRGKRAGPGACGRSPEAAGDCCGGQSRACPWEQVRGSGALLGTQLRAAGGVQGRGVPPTTVTRPAGSEGEAGPHPGASVSPGLTHICLCPLGGCSCPDSRSEGRPSPGPLLPAVWTSPERTCPLLTKRAGVGQSLSTEGKAGPGRP